MNKKKHPLIVLKEFKKVYEKIENTILELSDFIKIEEADLNRVIVKDLDDSSNFKFQVSNPEIKNRKVMFTVEHVPYSSSSIGIKKITVESDNAIQAFVNWNKLLLEYESISLSADEELANKYSKEQEEWFSMPEDESRDTPLEIGVQLSLDNYIQKGIEYAKKEHEDLLVEELESFKHTIGSLTKAQMINKLNSTLAKARVKSFKVFKELMRLLLSEGFSFVVQSTLTKMIQG